MIIWTAEIQELDRLYESFRDHLPDIEKELEQLIKTNDPNVVMLYSRRCLEVIVTDLCESELKRPRKTEPLKGIIDKLNSEEKVPSHIITSMLGVNSLSNYGAHPKDFDPEQVKPVLNNLVIVIKWYLRYKDFDIISKAEKKTASIINKSQETPFLNISGDSGRKRFGPKIIITVVFLVILIVVTYFLFPDLYRKGTGRSVNSNSIAVLPFTDMSPEKDQEYLGDGLAEDIIFSLSKIRNLKVIDRKSSFQFKGIEINLHEAGNKLGVKSILEGSVQKSGNRIRITVMLYNVDDGAQIWTEKWDREMTDIFEIQDEISSSITEKLKVAISDSPTIKSRHTNPEAYEAFLLGKYYFDNDFINFSNKAKDQFLRAIELDPGYVDAYAFLSFTYRAIGNFIISDLDSLNRIIALDSARIFANKAISLDDRSSLAHLVKTSFMWDNYDWINIEKEIRIANDLNPGSLEKIELSSFLCNFGQIDEAENLAREAVTLSPIDITTILNYAYVLFTARKSDQFLEQINRVFAIDPDNISAYDQLGFYYFAKKDYKEALKTWAKEKYIIGDSVLGDIYTNSDLESSLKAWLERSFSPDNPLGSNYFSIAYINAMLADKENTIKYLDKTVKARSPQIVGMKTDKMFDFVRDDPRFIAIYEKAGFKAYDDYIKIKTN
jgi:adenylate cyclase